MLLYLISKYLKSNINRKEKLFHPQSFRGCLYENVFKKLIIFIFIKTSMCLLELFLQKQCFIKEK